MRSAFLFAFGYAFELICVRKAEIKVVAFVFVSNVCIRCLYVDKLSCAKHIWHVVTVFGGLCCAYSEYKHHEICCGKTYIDKRYSEECFVCSVVYVCMYKESELKKGKDSAERGRERSRSSNEDVIPTKDKTGKERSRKKGRKASDCRFIVR